MRHARALFLALGVLLASPHQAGADNGVILHGGSTKGCSVKGIIRASFEPPKSEGEGLFGGEQVFGFIDSRVIGDLKRQAAALGANRIVIRDTVSEGTRYSHPRMVPWANWIRTTLIAEAVKC